MTERSPDPSLVTWTHVMYALHALAAVIGITGSVTVAGSFVFGLPSIIAIIMNYARRGEAAGTWLESHFTWQRDTFWRALVVALLVGIVSLVLLLIVVGFVTWIVGITLLGLWIIYRVLRGWLALKDARPVP
jgi:uncharacterized membrane protein